MFVPRGLVITTGPAHAGPVQDGFADSEVVKLQDHKAVTDVVTAKLRAQCPVLAHAEDAALRATLCKIADRFGAPKTAIADGVDAATLRAEGFDLVLDPTDELVPLWGDLQTLVDIDVIGDVHGHEAALDELLAELGYHGRFGDDGFAHPDHRLVVLVGDLVDKGPRPVAVLRRAMAATRKGQALVIRGNHEHKLASILREIAPSATTSEQWSTALLAKVDDTRWGRKHTLEQLAEAQECQDWRDSGFAEVRAWLSSLPMLIEIGGLHVVHAAFDDTLVDTPVETAKQRRDRETWLLHGGPNSLRTPRGDERPERPVWAERYQGSRSVVHGHDSVAAPQRTVNGNGGRVFSVDTGAGDGGPLSALRWHGDRHDFVTVATADDTA